MKSIQKLIFNPSEDLRQFAKNLWEVLKKHQTTRFAVLIANLDKRTVNQNKFYWLIVKHIAEAEGITKEDAHLSLKLLFLCRDGAETKLKEVVEQRDYLSWGRLPKTASEIPESKSLDKKNFPEYWKRCAKFGNAMFGLDLPIEPNEMTERQYLRYLEEQL